VSGKQSKRERKLQREAEREAARKQERQRTIITVIIVVIIGLVGLGLIWISLPNGQDAADDDAVDFEVDDADELEGDDAEAGEDGRPIACGAEAPPNADEDKPTFEDPDQVIEEGEIYTATVDTSCGQVVAELDAERAPETVNNFVFLATEGFYDGLEIFRHAESISALQTGAGTNDATWQIGYQIDDELGWAEDEGYEPGSLAMANSGPDSAGSQFFFVYDDGFDEGIAAGGLGPDYARFGTVTDGLDVLSEIAGIEIDGETPQERVFMESVEVEGPGLDA